MTAVLPENETNATSLLKTTTNNWYYLGKDGKPGVTGAQNIDGFNLTHEDGRLAKNEIVTIDGDSYYFDKDNGRRVTGLQALTTSTINNFGFTTSTKMARWSKMTSSPKMEIFTTLMLLVINLILSLFR